MAGSAPRRETPRDIAKSRRIDQLLRVYQVLRRESKAVRLGAFRPDEITRTNLETLDIEAIDAFVAAINAALGRAVIVEVTDLRGFERQTPSQPWMFHDGRDISERSG